MITWRDGEYEYSTDGKEVWRVKRDFVREAEEARNKASRLQTMRFKSTTWVIVCLLIELLALALLWQVIGGV